MWVPSPVSWPTLQCLVGRPCFVQIYKVHRKTLLGFGNRDAPGALSSVPLSWESTRNPDRELPFFVLIQAMARRQRLEGKDLFVSAALWGPLVQG